MGDGSADNEEETQRGEKVPSDRLSLFHVLSFTHTQFSSGLNNNNDLQVWGHCVRVSDQLMGLSHTLYVYVSSCAFFYSLHVYLVLCGMLNIVILI